MHKTLQIPVFLKAKQKNTVNYSIFGICQRTRVEPAEPNLRAAAPAADPGRIVK